MTVVVLRGGEQKLCRRGVTASHPAGALRSGPLAGRPGPPRLPPSSSWATALRMTHRVGSHVHTRVCAAGGGRVCPVPPRSLPLERRPSGPGSAAPILCRGAAHRGRLVLRGAGCQGRCFAVGAVPARPWPLPSGCQGHPPNCDSQRGLQDLPGGARDRESRWPRVAPASRGETSFEDGLSHPALCGRVSAAAVPGGRAAALGSVTWSLRPCPPEGANTDHHTRV